MCLAVRCDRCDHDAIIDQPYRRAHLCEPHFCESVVERVRREMHRQIPGFPGGTIAVGLSGGKDSAVALLLTQRYFRRRANVRLVAVSVDEGIGAYRPATLARARELTTQLGVEHRIVRFRTELGLTTDGARQRLTNVIPCAYCGVWRRQLLNRAARAVGADVVVLGFNLDDLAQTVLMNLARADLDRLARMAPHRTRQPGLVPRVAPLAPIPEREVFLYARLAGLPFDHGECPHASRAARNVYREAVWRLEEEIPGTRHALVRTQESLARLLRADAGAAGPRICRECGESASGSLCRACEYRTQARNSLIDRPASMRP
jgi:uncharacterized protein (TIGR00269 family)